MEKQTWASGFFLFYFAALNHANLEKHWCSYWSEKGNSIWCKPFPQNPTCSCTELFIQVCNGNVNNETLLPPITPYFIVGNSPSTANLFKNFKNLFLNTSTGWGFSTGTRAPDAKTSSAAAGPWPSLCAIQVTVTILMLSVCHLKYCNNQHLKHYMLWCINMSFRCR